MLVNLISHSLINLLHKHLRAVFCMPGAILGTGHIERKKNQICPHFPEFYGWESGCWLCTELRDYDLHIFRPGSSFSEDTEFPELISKLHL